MRDRLYGKINLNNETAQNLKILQELGLNLELCITDSTFLFENFEQAGKDLKRLIAGLKLATHLHLPFYGLQLGCKDYYIRKLSLELIMQGLLRALELNIPAVIMHVSFPPYLPDKGKVKWLESFYENLEKILYFCEKNRMFLHLENTYEPKPAIFNRIFEKFPSGNIAMCLDIAHINCYAEKGFREWWNSLDGKIKIIHLSDNKREEDSHLALGEGIIDFREVFALSADRAIDYTLETEVSNFRRSLDYLESFIFRRAEETGYWKEPE